MTILFESAIRVTLIAAIIALVLFAMRIKRAAVLHAVWASVVLLMMLLPAWVAWGPKAPLPVLPPERSPAIELLPPPLPAGLAERSSAPSLSPVREDGGYPVIPVIYLLGTGVLLLRLGIGTVRATRLQSCVVPITVGILRPRILLPETAKQWPRAQLDAVLAHEREHARRRDPLFQWLALLNRAIFWFHPLAWWLERKISGLAEEACDATVIAGGYDAREYSEYLLDLARSVERAGARIEAVGMAMPGIGLTHRIRQMLSGVPVPRISRPRMACTVAICAAAAAILAAGTLVRAQSKAVATPKFEVASIRRCKEEPGQRGGGGNSSPGRLRVNCTTVKGLINQAYLLFANGRFRVGLRPPIEGGPAWINSEHYEINAKAEGSVSPVMMNGPMLQALLEDRFKLRVHRETRDVPVYTLTVAKDGLKLQPFKEGSCTPVDRSQFAPFSGPPSQDQIDKNCHARGTKDGLNLKVDAQGMTIDEFSKIFLDTHTLGRPVINKADIAGRFDFHLEYAPENRGVPADEVGGGPSIFTALQEQLGLKLESAKGPGEFFVIDSVERPSEN